MSMGGETGSGSWFGSLFPLSRKGASDDKAAIGILASDVAGLMLKVINLWHSLSDWEITILRQGIASSVGVKMLVSDDDYFLMELALNEILDNFKSIARSVARLGKKCKDPVYHQYERFVHNPAQNRLQWSGWEYAWKKMERKVKKMERFVAVMAQLSEEMEVLAEREQTLRRMQANRGFHQVELLKFQKKVMWQRQEVRNLKDMSPWIRSYDYVVRLLARSLFTILERIIIVFGNYHLPTEQQQNGSPRINTNILLPRSRPFSDLKHSPVRPSENDHYGFHFGPFGRRAVSNSGFVVDDGRRKKKQQQVLPSPALYGKHLRSESKQLGHVGSFKGCMSVGDDSPMVHNCMLMNGGSVSTRVSHNHLKKNDKLKTVDKVVLFSRSTIYSKLSLGNPLKPAPFTLGDAALHLHYANLIILIEKIVSSSHPIDLQARDELYNMLPCTTRTALWAKLRLYSKSKASMVFDANAAEGWSLVLTQILEWLAPLAHNMIRWHSERNFEKEHCTSKANILLVQTLHFANQAKTEAAILELIVGLHYVCRVDREDGLLRDPPKFAGSRYSSDLPLRKNGKFNKYL